MTVHAAILLLAQVAAPPPPAPPAPAPAPASTEEPRNLVPAWTEDPIVTLISDNPRAELTKVDVSPEQQFIRRPRSSSLGLQETKVCGMPCATRLSSSALYRVTGDGITRSRLFTLPRGERAVVDVKKSGSPALFGLGSAIAIAGSLALGIGIGLLASGEDRTIPGIVTLGGGLGLMTGGILLAVQGVTSVEVKGDGPVVRPSPEASPR